MTKPVPVMNGPVSKLSRGDLFVFTVLLLLSGQGMLNYVLGGSIFAAWKQIVLVVCFCVALFRIRTLSELLLVTYVLVAALVLLISGLFEGRSVGAFLFNIFYYIAWLPFYIVGKSFELRDRSVLVGRACLAFIVLGAAGLAFQLFTPYFDFLKDQEDAEIRAQLHETQRFAFVFVASTLVMPTLAGIYYLYLLVSESLLPKLWGQLSLVLAAIPTGALSGLIMLGTSFAMTLARLKARSLMYFCVVLASVAIVALALSNELVDIQINRMLTNTSQTESNQGRLALWNSAMKTIAGFPIEEKVFGAGVGVTNANRAGQATFPHGESSFFQAMIEGGLIGLSLRLLPFYLLLRVKRPKRYQMMDQIFGFGLLLCCSSAPIFGAFGVQCLLGFNAGLSRQFGADRGD